MIAEANDFLAESDAIYQLIKENTDCSLLEETAFKAWTLEDIIRHLHMWNKMAYFSLSSQAEFDGAFQKLMEGLDPTGGLRPAERKYMGDLKGIELLNTWQQYAAELANAFENADPEQRVPWAGPPMSAQSSITARLMETWSHAQAIYDRLGVERQNADRIRSIAELGVRTYRWTFANRGQDAPLPKPHVRLVAPSGAIWTWNEESSEERVDGDAAQFCQVVTQSRNIADTGLKVTGDNATLWMSIAQCFAGGAETPPAQGERGLTQSRGA
jgi:uncharacterized protein (TIGR03084 family)